MAESKVNRNNYISVQGFMVRDLQLKGNELLVYAVIYGFSQAENQVFNGSLQYLADWTNSTKQGVLRCLKSLAEKDYIRKNEKIINGVKFCEYYATDLQGVLNKVEYPIKQSLTGGIKQSSPNNIGLNKQEDNTEKKSKKEITLTLFDKLRLSYELTEDLTDKIRDWLTYKVERKEEYTEQGLKALLSRISKNCSEYGETALIELIDESMSNNWKGIIFDRLQAKPKQGSFDTDSFYNKAVERSLGGRAAMEREASERMEKKDVETAETNEYLRKKAEELKNKLSG